MLMLIAVDDPEDDMPAWSRRYPVDMHEHLIVLEIGEGYQFLLGWHTTVE